MVDIEVIGVGVDSKGVVKGTNDLDKFGQAANKASKDADNLGNKTESSFSKVAAGAKGAAIGIAAVGTVIVGIGAALLSTAIQIEKLNNTLKFSTGSAAGAAKELEYLKETTNRLGLEFSTTATAYAKFSAASKGTNLEGQKTRDIFEAIAKASTVLGLSADETGGALKAIEQIISKGTVSAEELRGQLGERLPGAFQIAARAMGVTTQELGKMLEQGQLVSDVFLPKFAEELTKTLGDNPNSAAGSAQAQLNRLSNAWTDFKKAISETGVITIVLNVAEGTTNALKWFNHFVFNKGELADIYKLNADRENLARLENLVNTRKPESSMFETAGMKNARLNSFNTAQAKDKAEIRKLRLSLGLDDGSSTSPATGNTIDSLLAPNFGVTKKDGEGGYDARLNNQKEIDEYLKNQKIAFDKAKDYAGKLAQLKSDILVEEAQDNRIRGEKAQKDLEDRAKIKQDLDNKQYEVANDIEKNLLKIQEEHEKKIYKIKEDNLEKLKKEQERISDDLTRSLTDALMRGFENGKDFAKNFRDTLVNIFKTLVLQPIIKFLVDSSGISAVLGALGSVFSGGASASSSGSSASGGGIGGLFSSVKSFFSGGNASIISAIEGFGSTIANGLGGLRDTIGGFVGANAGMIANVSTFAGAALSLLQGDIKGAAFQGAGAAIGLAFGGPIGGAIGSFLGGAVGGLFGKKKRPRFDSNVLGSFNTQTKGFTTSQGATQYKRLGADAQLGGLGEQFSRTLDVLLSGFGVGSNITTTNRLLQKRKYSYGMFDATVNGQQVSAGVSTKGKNSAQESFNKLIETVLGTTLVQAIQKTNLSAGVKKFFDGLTKKEDVVETVNALVYLNSALTDLPPVFDAIRNAIDTTAYKTSVADLKTRFAALNTYTSLFYTEQENLDTFTKKLATQLSDLNTALPTSRDEYRKLVDGIKVTDESTSNLFNGLVALAPAMDIYFKALQQQAEALQQQNEAVKNLNESMGLLDINRFKTLVDYTRAQRYSDNGISLSNLPSYDVGTSFVQGNQIAQIHNGERIIPAADNLELMARLRNPDSSALIVEISKLRQENQAQGVAMVQATQKMAKILDKFDNQGIALSETNNSGTRIILDTRVVA